MRRAKIICTIGPASETVETLSAMIEAGMDAARLNMSHADHAYHARSIARIREASRAAGREIAILLDLSGPKIRLGDFPGIIEVKPGGEYLLTVGETAPEPDSIPVRHPDLPRELAAGDRLSMNDGLITMRVIEVLPGAVRVKALSGGPLSARKGVNLPTGGGSLPSLTEKDEADLVFGLGEGVDWVGLSFVRKASDAGRVRGIMAERGVVLPLMAKIEKGQALQNLEEIIAAFDGVMVARGDLGAEVDLEDLPAHQKRIIRLANRAAKPVVTATQMLLSMVASKRPTRAEVTDVANAVLDGADAVMLSEETAMGANPVEAVRMMSSIAERAALIKSDRTWLDDARRQTVAVDEAIGRATPEIAREVGAKLIITPTGSGSTARLIAAMRPDRPIMAISTNRETVRRLALTWGVTALLVEEMADTDDLFRRCREKALSSGLARPGDRAVVTAGVPVGRPGTTNMLKVLEL